MDATKLNQQQRDSVSEIMDRASAREQQQSKDALEMQKQLQKLLRQIAKSPHPDDRGDSDFWFDTLYRVRCDHGCVATGYFETVEDAAKAAKALGIFSVDDFSGTMNFCRLCSE